MSEARRQHLEQERGVWAESGEDITRIAQFSDGVFAIAVTLLALEIRIPALTVAQSATQLTPAIVALLPRILVYVLTFMNISVMWIAHHRAFTHIHRYDTTLLWMNAFFLMLVAFLPVASSTLGSYPTRPAAVVFYGVVLLAVTLGDLQIWLYATSKRRLVDSDIDPRVVRYITLSALFPGVVFALAIPVAFFAPTAAEIMMGAAILATQILGRVYSPVLAHVASHPKQRTPRGPSRSENDDVDVPTGDAT
jgi:uncharacterized membrane protein